MSFWRNELIRLAAQAKRLNARTYTGTSSQITVTEDADGNLTFSLPADLLIPGVLTVPNTGLHLLDTNASHDLIISPGSNLSADRTLSLVTGDAGRTLTLNGNPTLDDWFDQSVKVAASPQFASIQLGHASDTTLTRTGAGDIAVEGNQIYRVGGTDVAPTDGGTGIGTYATGDILYASAANVLSKLAAGTNGHFLKLVAGVPAWAAISGSITAVAAQEFVADGTYTPTTGTAYCLAIVTGAGGAGGNATGTTSVGGGGGGGGTAIGLFPVASLTGQSIDVGTTSGASSSIGAVISATGGSAGANDTSAGSSTTMVAGGAGGVGSGGDLNLAGAAGHFVVKNTSSVMVSGNGGASMLGGGGLGRTASSDAAGNSGGSYGGGGAGGAASGATDRNGGAGGQGVVYIIEFIS